MEDQGMVAVVRGLKDASLAVTLLDGNKQYTLMPNYAINKGTSTTTPTSAPLYHHAPQRTQQTQQTQQTQYQQESNINMSTDSSSRCNSGAQASDGRYASTYQTMHCNVYPTSPPQHLSEFPPQRSQVAPGHGNFEIGGAGSGDMSPPVVRSNSFRGALCWPDRGSICTPRPSQDIDAFAKSLRKYPSISLDRSSEIVEKLITYTQNKTAAKCLQGRTSQSPTRISETFSSSQNLDRSSRYSSKPQRSYDPELRARPRTEEAPTRERDMRYRPESPNRPIYGKSFDIRYIRDNLKRDREIKRYSSYPQNLPSPNFRERCTDVSPEQKQQNNNSVNAEIQAGVKMVSRESATVPRPQLSTRTVAVSLSTSQLAANQTPEGAVPQTTDKLSLLESSTSFKTAQTTIDPCNLRKSVQTTISFIDLDNRWRCNENVRKSRSEEFKVSANGDIMYLLKHAVLNARNNDFDTNRCVQFEFQIDRCDESSVRKCRHIYQYKHYNNINHRSRKKMHIDDCICVYRAEITPFQIIALDNEIENVINDWINMLDIKTRDSSDKPVDRKYIFNIVRNRLKFLINGRPKYEVLDNLKYEIMDIVKDIHLEIKGCNNKWVYTNNVVEILFNKVKSLHSENVNSDKRETKFCGDQKLRSQLLSKFRNHIQPTQEEFKDIIVVEIMKLVEKLHLKVDFLCWNNIEVELTDILLDSMEAIRQNDDTNVKNEIITILIEVGGLSENQSIQFANILIEQIRDIFSVIDKGQTKYNFLSQTFVVMPSLNYSRYNKSYNNESSDFRIGRISNSDIEANFNIYTNQIAQHIEDWLINLQLPGIDDKSRQVIVKDLAGDIVDRQKYLELHPGSRGSNNDELNYLKYQLFKWINKFTGDDSTLIVENAADLMQRIQKIPVPMLMRPNEVNHDNVSQQISGSRRMNTSQMPMFGPSGPGGSMTETSGRKLDNRRLSSPGALTSGPMLSGNPYDIGSMPMFGPAGLGGSMVQSARDVTTNRRLSSPGAIPYIPMQVINEAADYPVGQRVGNSAAPGSQANVTMLPTFKETNDEYEEFVNNWVQEIPIPAKTPQEKELADKMRQGIFNGVWKSLAKIKSNPSKYHDTFHIEDVLDDDIEELLDMLPHSQELDSKKFNLKNKLISKTTGTTKKLKLLLDPSYYKEELIDKFLRVWPRRTVTKTDDEDPIKLFEELQALKLVEDFILYIRYKEDDKIKSNIYKNKLLKNVKDLVLKVKESHGKELQDISSERYVNNIFTALHLVPIPNDETIKEEADEILLGLEVDQWYTDLPLIESDDPEEHLKRRRLRDALVKKIHILESEGSLSNSNVEDELKHETSKFINKLPIPQDESLNINFMVEELVNRVKNRPKSSSSKRLKDTGKTKSVAFNESVAYEDFSRVMPCCSSFTEIPGSQRAQVNETQHTIYMRDATRPSIDYSKVIGNKQPPAPVRPFEIPQNHFDPTIHESQQQWFTLHESGAPVRATSGVPPANLWTQQPSHTYQDNTSQIQFNQSGRCEQMPAQAPHDNIASKRQDQASLQQTTSNQFPMDVQNISQQVNQSARLYNLGQQAKRLKDTDGRKSVGFNESVAYEDFSRVMPVCSSFTELPGSQRAQVNETQHTIYMRDATRPSIDYSEAIGNKRPPAPVPFEMPQNQVDPTIHESQQQWFTLHESGAPVRATSGVPPANLWTQQPSNTYQDNTSQIQFNQSGRCEQMPAQAPHDNIASMRQDQASLQQTTSNQFPMKVQNISQQVNQSARLYNLGQQATCGSKLLSQNPFQQLPNQVPTHVQSLPYPYDHSVIPPQLNQSLPLNLLAHQSKSQLPFQGQQQIPNQFSNQETDQSVRSYQPVQQTNCGTQLPCQGSAVQILPQVSNQSIASQTPQPCDPILNTPILQAPVAGCQTSRGVLSTSQMPGPSSQRCNLIGRLNQSAPCASQINLPIPNQNVPSNTQTQPLSAFGLPVGHSTPQNAIPRENLPKVIRKRTREPQRLRENARRQIDIEQPYEDDEDTDSDGEELCQCMERFRYRRRPMCSRYDDYSMNFRRFPMWVTPVADDHKKWPNPISEETGLNPRKNVNKYKHVLNNRNNIKFVETASSSINFDESYGKELLANKSQDMNTNTLDIEEDIQEWFQVDSNKVKVKIWDKKLKRLAKRLRIPGEEEKLKIKMEQYLKRVPSQFSDCDEDRRELREQLPYLFIRKLKKFYLTLDEFNPTWVYRDKVLKCYKNEDDVRNIIKTWLKGLYFKKRDYLGRTVKRNNICEFVNNKLQLFEKGRQSTDEEYVKSLKSEVKDIINILPIVFESNDTKDFVSRQADILVNQLLENGSIKKLRNKTENAELDLQSREKDDQFLDNVIKDFVTNEIKVFLQKFRVDVTTNRIACLEADLTDILVDATDSLEKDIESKFEDEVYTVLKNVGKFTNFHAKQFTRLLFNNFQNLLNAKKENLFKSPLDFNNSTTYLVYPVQSHTENMNKNKTMNSNMRTVTESDFNANKNKQYMIAIVNQVQEWFENNKIPTSQDEGFLQVAVKDLAGDIVDRHTYLELNPSSKGSDEEELEYLKYQIYKWIYHLVGGNVDIVQYAPDLMQRIQNTFVLLSEPQENVSQELSNKESNVPPRDTPPLNLKENQPVNDPKLEKLRIRKYEDIIDDWIDKFPKPKKSESIFTYATNEHVHELAVSINKIKHQTGVSADDIANQLKDVFSQWIKTLPLPAQTSKTSNPGDIADNLVQRVQQCNIDEYLMKEKTADGQVPASQPNTPPASSSPNLDIVRDVITDWSRNLPLKPVYCPREFSSLIERMAAEITKLLANPKYSTVAENGKEIMRTIFLYLRDFPIKTENNVHEQLSKMAYLLWRHFIDMNLCRDDSGNSSSIMFKRPKNDQNYDRPLNFHPQRSGPDPNTSQVAGPSCKNVCSDATAKGNQNPYPGYGSASQVSYKPANVNANQVKELRMFGPTGPGGSMTENRPIVVPNRRMSYPNNLKSGPLTNESPLFSAENIHQVPKSRNPVDLFDYSDIPQGMQLQELFSYYKPIITELCNQLSFPGTVSEGDVIILRKIMEHCISSTFNAIAADNVIRNDYAYAEYIFENKINELLREFPQSPELNSVREAWTSKVIAHVMNSLKYLQGLKDTRSFREMLQRGYSRYYAREKIQTDSERALQNFIAIVMDLFLRSSEFKEDTLKAKIYRHKLANKLEEYCRNVAKDYNNNFNNMNLYKLEENALKYLNELPKPDSNSIDITVDEEKEILLNEEIKKWYQGLPVHALKNPAIWQRRIEVLTNKIYSLEKRMDLDDSSLENQIKHEISVFLEKQAMLQNNEDLNINLMVDELVNRLKNMENKPTMLGYVSFEKEKPISSSFIQPDLRVPLTVQQTGLPYQSCAGQVDIGSCSVAAGPTTTTQADRSHNACPSAKLYQPCQVQALAGPITTKMSHPCSRSVISQIGSDASAQAPSGHQSGQTTPSTARIVTTKPEGSQRLGELDEESEDTDERRKRCRCKYRFRRKRRCYYLDHDGDPNCYRMPMFYPDRCFY